MVTLRMENIERLTLSCCFISQQVIQQGYQMIGSRGSWISWFSSGHQSWKSKLGGVFRWQFPPAVLEVELEVEEFHLPGVAEQQLLQLGQKQWWKKASRASSQIEDFDSTAATLQLRLLWFWDVSQATNAISISYHNRPARLRFCTDTETAMLFLTTTLHPPADPPFQIVKRLFGETLMCGSTRKM